MDRRCVCACPVTRSLGQDVSDSDDPSNARRALTPVLVLMTRTRWRRSESGWARAEGLGCRADVCLYASALEIGLIPREKSALAQNSNSEMPQLEIKLSGNETERVSERGGGGGGDKQECVCVCVERQRTVPLPCS